jgi:hypothetical protein
MKKTAVKPDYKFMMWKNMLIVALIFLAGTLIMGTCDYQHQQKQKALGCNTNACYKDSTAWLVSTYVNGNSTSGKVINRNNQN